MKFKHITCNCRKKNGTTTYQASCKGKNKAKIRSLPIFLIMFPPYGSYIDRQECNRGDIMKAYTDDFSIVIDKWAANTTL